jgi:hypothetical protein
MEEYTCPNCDTIWDTGLFDPRELCEFCLIDLCSECEFEHQDVCRNEGRMPSG